MKILAVIGSGKVGGNTQQLVEAFAKGAQENGHEVVFFHLGKQTVGPCVGCNACRQLGHCVQKDGFEEFLAAFESCDLVALSTPLYFWGISAQLKALIDRLYAIGEKDPKDFYFLYPKKKCVLLATAADISRHFWAFELVEQYYRRLVGYLRWEDLGTLLATGCGGSSAPRRIGETKNLQRAYEFGKTIL